MKNLKLSFGEIKDFDDYFEIKDAKLTKYYIPMIALILTNIQSFIRLYEADFDFRTERLSTILGVISIISLIVVVFYRKKLSSVIKKEDIKEINDKKIFGSEGGNIIILHKDKKRFIPYKNSYEAFKIWDFLRSNK